MKGTPPERRDGRPPARDPARGFAFSMKDLAVPDLIEELKATGVDSLKIEGRKKSPLYVATTVDFYRRLLDGKLDSGERAQREADLQTVFARKWTSLYLRSHADKAVADPDTFGHRGTPIGSVEAVVRDGRQVLVQFRTARRLAFRDGLQIDLPGQGRPFGFAVDAMRLAGTRRNVMQAPAGSRVEVALPDGYSTLTLGAPVYCSSSQEVKQRFRTPEANLGVQRVRRALDLVVELSPTALRLRGRVALAAGLEPVSCELEVAGSFEGARDREQVENAVRVAMGKLGDTSFSPGSLEVSNPRGVFVPVSKLNEARRGIAARLEEAVEARWKEHLAHVTARVLAPAPAASDPGQGAGALRWSLKIDRLAHLESFEDCDYEGLDELVVDLGREGGARLAEELPALAERLGHQRVRLALPMITRRWEERGLRARIERLRGLGFGRWQAANVSAWSFLGLDPGRRAGDCELTADWSMYAMNREAARQLLTMGASGFTLSTEDGLVNLRALLSEFPEQATVVVFQDSPLFISESCPYATLSGECPGPAQCTFEEQAMTSGHGSEVLAYSDRCRTVVVNREPFSLAGRLPELVAAGSRRVRADFVFRRYSPVEVRDLWRRLRAGDASVRGHVANFDRGLA